MGFPGSVLLNQGDIYQQTSDKRHPLGTRGYTRDGRAFRYARAGGTALAAAKLMCSPISSADHDRDCLFSSDYETPTTSSTVIYLSTGTSLTTAGYFNDGYFFCNDGTGEGQMVQIKGDDGATTAAADVFPTFYPYEEDKFTATFDTSSEVGVVKNIYDKVIVRPDSARTSLPVGVTPRAVTASYYFWLQTWGPCPCWTVDAVTAGYPVSDDTATSTGSAGYVHEARSTSTDNSALLWGSGAWRVGDAVVVGAAAEITIINITLAP